MTNAEYQLQRREQLAERGLCRDCGNKPMREGSTRCVDCLGRHSQYDKQYVLRRRDRLRAAGICTICGREPAREGVVFCVKCIEKRKGYAHAYKAQNKTRGGVRETISFKMAGGKTFREIGKELGISWQMAQRICEDALQKVRKEFLRRGIDGSSIVGSGFSMLANAERWADE